MARPLTAIFLDIIMSLAILVDDKLKTIATKYQLNLASGFVEEDFQSVLHSHNMENCHAPWRSYRLRYHHEFSIPIRG